MITATQINITEGGWRHPVNAVIWQSGPAPAKNLPLVLFGHGVGEKGDWHVPSDVNKLLTQGLPLVLNNGFIPPFDCIIIAIQQSSWSPSVTQHAAVIDEAFTMFGIDRNKVYLTGLSAGGQSTFLSQFSTDINTAKKFAAIAPLSAANFDDTIARNTAPNFKQTLTPVWCTCGANDPIGLEPYNAYYVNLINAQVPGLATYTKIPNTGHGEWDKVYNGTIKDANGKTIWDFFNGKSRSGVVAPPVVIPPVVIPPIPVKKLMKTISVYDDFSIDVK